MDVTSDARTALLNQLFDYAGVFPPASLPLGQAVAGYQRHRQGPEGWLVGPFVCRATQLGELATVAGPDLASWKIAVVLDHPDPEWTTNIRTGMGEAAILAARTGARIAQFETSIQTAGAMRTAIDLAVRTAGEANVYFEVAAREEHALFTAIDSLAKERDALGPRVRVKLRCGGTRVPTPAGLAAGIEAVLDRELRAKATAGLHAPFRSDNAHGFLNVAAAFLLGGNRTALAAILSDEDPASFTLSRAEFGWRGRMLGSEDVAYRRYDRFAGIGTCSINEPLGHLDALGVL